MQEMLQSQKDVFYYLTVSNENYAQPDAPRGITVEDVTSGLYCFTEVPDAQVNLLGSGAIMTQVLAAQCLLQQDWGIAARVFSATSYSELHRDGMACEARPAARWRAAHQPGRAVARSESRTGGCGERLRTRLARTHSRLHPAALRHLGTDGFGRSDRRAALRRFFEVDAEHIVLAALSALADEGTVQSTLPGQARQRYGLQDEVSPGFAEESRHCRHWITVFQGLTCGSLVCRKAALNPYNCSEISRGFLQTSRWLKVAASMLLCVADVASAAAERIVWRRADVRFRELELGGQ